MQLLALCPFGLEKLTRDELKGLGCAVTSSAAGKVFFEGEWETVLKTNLWLRTAERVLIVVASFSAPNFEALFEGVRSACWEDWISPLATVTIEKAKSFRSALTSIPTIQSVAQKAIFQRLCGIWGLQTLPQTGPTSSIRLYLEHDRVLAAIDTTGAALHQRGYRTSAGDAPLKENLAAALLLFSGWRRKHPLVDPLCGSGTILAEALLFALDIPPGGNRKFAFETLAPHQSLDWKLLREEARERVDLSRRIRIVGSDRDEKVLNFARQNLARLGISTSVVLEKLSMEEASAERWGFGAEEAGFLITNPPYGERLFDRPHAENLSRQMRHFSRSFAGWKLGVLTSLETFPTEIGLPPFKIRDLMNASLPVRYYQFEL